MYLFTLHTYTRTCMKNPREKFFPLSFSPRTTQSFPQKIELIANNFFFFLLFNFCFFFFHTSYIIHTPRYVFNTHFLLLSENLCRNKNKFALSLYFLVRRRPRFLGLRSWKTKMKLKKEQKGGEEYEKLEATQKFSHTNTCERVESCRISSRVCWGCFCDVVEATTYVGGDNCAFVCVVADKLILVSMRRRKKKKNFSSRPWLPFSWHSLHSYVCWKFSI